MIAALLLDLDQTLLDNPNETFLPAYFESLTEQLSRVAASERVIPALQAGVAAALANTDPRRTLGEAFDESFYATLGAGRDVVKGLLADFYRDQYPALARLTGMRPAARELLTWAAQAGLRVVIATNPLYPLAAIEQRLEWAGLSPREFALAWVPTLENMHFAKPYPEYFAELLGLLQLRPHEALMVGDDWERDMVGAEAAGLHTFWIRPPNSVPPEPPVAVAGQGTLADFLRWARDEKCLDTLGSRPGAPAGYLASLAGNLAAFHTLAAHTLDWKRQPAHGEWSLTQILCHLRDVEAEVNLPRLQRVGAEPEPFFSAADTDPWAAERDYQSQDGLAALGDFGEARLAALDYLRAAPAGYWTRAARHALLGRTTPIELISFTLEHDRMHLAQIRSLNRPAVA
jgi:FMN phosphatase YigB (HAD superfamily)